MPDGLTIKRRQFDLDPDNADSDSIRVYYAPDSPAPPMPSVTTIKGVRVDPEKEDSLEGWRTRFDGQSAYGRPWYKDQKVFKGYRGTLIHFAILNELGDASGDTYFHDVGESDYGKEEYWAEYCLKKWSRQAPSANSDEVPYVPRNNQYDGEHAWDKAMRGMRWATKAFKEQIIDTGHLRRENVIDVESFVFDTQYGYGGQFDLLYETDDGETILSDLKTSSAIRFGHKLQSAAYKRAVENERGITVDQTEVLRLHPDSETVEIERSDEWDRSLQGLQHEFLGLCDKAWGIEYSDVLERAKEELQSEHEESSQQELASVSK